MNESDKAAGLTPLERYQQDLAREDFLPDDAQAQAVALLQDLYERLVKRYGSGKEKKSGWLNRFFKASHVEPERGLYFWGGVGRGKTYLVDIFYEALPFKAKKRVHFHRFMQKVHQDLKKLQGEKNPLEVIAERYANEFKVICFDEFFVSDITDAMILGGLFEALFKRGVTLVATSNIVPDRLYENGLQRDRFLPAIRLVNEYTQVVNVDGGVDYRLRALERAEIYHYPLGEDAETSLARSFAELQPESHRSREGGAVSVNGREIPVRYLADDIAWFDFHALCDGPRSQNDYIELAREFHAVLVSDVPRMRAAQDDMARRFINMVDEFYDRGVKLILSAEVDIDELYAEGKLEFEFERTRSRLLEMQSHEYLARPHKP